GASARGGRRRRRLDARERQRRAIRAGAISRRAAASRVVAAAAASALGRRDRDARARRHARDALSFGPALAASTRRLLRGGRAPVLVALLVRETGEGGGVVFHASRLS